MNCDEGVLLAVAERWEAEAKALVASMMKDPTSAQFRDVFSRSLNGADDYVVCGSVNAKNGFGAYVGFRRFFAVAGELPVVAEDKDFFNEYGFQWDGLRWHQAGVDRLRSAIATTTPHSMASCSSGIVGY